MDDIIKNLGPLAALAGTWEGDKGNDLAPDANRDEGNIPFRERMIMEPMGPVKNHEQIMYGLRYNTVAFRLSDGESFHEEFGYWLWDVTNGQVMRCFTIPRGMAILAGGTTTADAKSFELAASVGSETYGVSSNKFLDQEFKTVRFECKVTVNDDGSFTYEQDTQLQMKGRPDVFHHRDQNTLRRVDD